MPRSGWRPASEADAVSARAVFIEWLAAVHGVVLPGPAALAEWRGAAPAAFADAISRFAGLVGHSGLRAALLHGCGARTALIVVGLDGKRRVWSRADLKNAQALAGPIEQMLGALAPADLPSLAASHLLDVGTTPDICVAWEGEPHDPWPLGAWLVGAAVILAEPGADSRGAAVFRSAPPWRA